MREYYKRPYQRQLYDAERIIEIIIETANKLNKIPTIKKLKITSSVIYRYFDTWDEALNKSKVFNVIYPDIDFDKYPKDDIIAKLKNLTIRFGRVPTKQEILNLFPEPVIEKYFKHYRAICNILNYEYSKEELIDILKQKFKQDSKVPNNKDMKIPQAIIFIRKFGSWENAIKEANLV